MSIGGSIQPLFLVLDVAATTGAIIVLGVEGVVMNTPYELGAGVLAGYVLNSLFMTGSTDAIVAHAAFGALLGWFFFPKILQFLVNLYGWWSNL
jgi:hypothetical protein